MKKLPKWVQITVVVLTILLGLFLISSGIFTVIGNSEMNQLYTDFGLADMRVVIGVGKIVSSILFLIPSTFMIGALLLTAFWGGTIVAHMTVGDPIIFQSVFLIITILIILLRKPEVFGKN